jgi:hypothetical protein
MENIQDILSLNNDRSTRLLQSVVAFLPKLLLAIVLWIAFWFIAKAVRAGILFLLEKVGLERLTEKTGITSFLAHANFKKPIS